MEFAAPSWDLVTSSSLVIGLATAAASFYYLYNNRLPQASVKIPIDFNHQSRYRLHPGKMLSRKNWISLQGAARAGKNPRGAVRSTIPETVPDNNRSAGF